MRRTRPRLGMLALAVVVAVVVAGGVWWLNRDDRARAGAGQVLTGSPEQVDGDSKTVQIPWGRLHVEVGYPTVEYAEPGAAKAGLRAPKDGSFIGLAVEIDQDVQALAGMPRVPSGEPRVPDLTLVADGRRYPVDGLVGLSKDADGRDMIETDGRAKVVAVAGPGSSRQLELSYDGQSQVLDLTGSGTRPGRFGLLERPVKTVEQQGLVAAFPAGFREDDAVAASLALRRVPYVAGLGWAPEGKSWPVVTHGWNTPHSVYWRSRSGRLERAVVDDDPTRFAFASNGRPPVSVADVNALNKAGDVDGPHQLVFPAVADAQPVPVEVTQTLRLVDANYPDLPTSTVPLRWRVRLG